jgi:hypothetical protein
MRKKIIITVFLLLVGIYAYTVYATLTIPTLPQYSHPPLNQYYVWRTVSDTNDTQLTAATQKTISDAPADGLISFAENIGAFIVHFRLTAANDANGVWTIWASKSIYDPWEYVANGTVQAGLTQTGNTNEFYADTIPITDQQWFSPVFVVADAPDAIIPNGGIAKLVILNVYDYHLFKIILAKNHCAKIGADICGLWKR